MRLRRVLSVCLVELAAVAAACNAPMVLTQQVEARRLASDLQVQFTRAADAANRSVMSDTDDDAMTAAREAEQTTQAVLRDVEQLQSILKSMGYSEELRFLDTFKARFADYQKLDAEILPLAVENTNLKAQRPIFRSGWRSGQRVSYCSRGRSQDGTAGRCLAGRCPCGTSCHIGSRD